MYNHTITRISYLAIFRLLFCAGVAVGGGGGLVLGLLERDVIGIWGGMFLGLLFGLVSGLTGLVYTVVFNVLAPVAGGIPIHLEELPGEVSPETEQATSEPEQNQISA